MTFSYVRHQLHCFSGRLLYCSQHLWLKKLDWNTVGIHTPTLWQREIGDKRMHEWTTEEQTIFLISKSTNRKIVDSFGVLKESLTSSRLIGNVLVNVSFESGVSNVAASTYATPTSNSPIEGVECWRERSFRGAACKFIQCSAGCPFPCGIATEASPITTSEFCKTIVF